jgi:hypothetical protein
MAICKECGKEVKRLTHLHVRTHGLTMAKYTEKYGVVMPEGVVEEEIGEVTEHDNSTTTITPQEVKDRIFDGGEKTLVETPFKEWLSKWGITEKEANDLASRYVKGSAIDTTQKMNINQKLGSEEAQRLAKLRKHSLSTSSIFTAESLCKDHGYKVIQVKSGPPKTWFLTNK